MQYLGGKKRIAKKLIDFLNPYLNNVDYYFEPFVGSCAVIENISHLDRRASDGNEYLIAMYKALQNGWIPPQNITEFEYQYVKQNKDLDKALTAFCGIGCSFSGKWFGGYCRDKKNTNRNYALNAHNTLLKQLPKIKNVLFKHSDYREWNPKKSLIYCDPPYCHTTGYGLFDKFDSDEFWDIAREWSKNNIVFISEYQAPNDFECVFEILTRTDMKNSNGKTIPRTEKIFQHKDGIKIVS